MKYTWNGKVKTWINGLCIHTGKTVELDKNDLIFTTSRGKKLSKFTEPKPIPTYKKKKVAEKKEVKPEPYEKFETKIYTTDTEVINNG